MTQTTKTLTQTMFPAIRYVDARAAIAWLANAFGAETRAAYDGPDGTIAHAEMRIAGNIFMFGSSREGTEFPVRSPKETGTATAGIYIVLPDAPAVDTMHARAVAAGASITRPPNDTDYGSHEFGALDLEGHPWSFGTYDPNRAE